MYTVARARETLAALLPTLDEIVALRADTAELAAAVTNGAQTSLGGTPEFKAAQARLDELVTELTIGDFQVKGLAPLLLDFPARVRRGAGTALLARGRSRTRLVSPH